MKLSNNIDIFCKSMGETFRILHIAKSTQEANDFCEKHEGCGVIAVEKNTGLVFIAENKPFTS